MSENFYTILTNLGKAKLANASILNEKVNFKTLVLGDSNGDYYEPTENQESLRNEVYRVNISSIKIDENNPNWIIVKSVIAGSVGGFTIREVGILDDEDNLLAIAKYPQTYKPNTNDGSIKDLIINIILEVSNASTVSMKVDPTVILTTKKDLEEKADKEHNHSIKDITGFDEKINNLINENKLLEKIKKVDGAGSGLDADLLDGKNASDFAQASHRHEASEIDNLSETIKTTKVDNADKLDNLDSIDFIQQKHRTLRIEELNNANFPYSYEASTSEAKSLGLPTNWAFIKYLKHEDNNGYGTQIAYKLSNNNEGDGKNYWTIAIRLADENVFGQWTYFSDSMQCAFNISKDANACTKTGMYYVSTYFEPKSLNLPDFVSDCIIQTYSYENTNNGVQMAFSWHEDLIAYRRFRGNPIDFTPWRRIATVDNVQGQLNLNAINNFSFRNNNGNLQVLVNGVWLSVGAKQYTVVREGELSSNERFDYIGGSGILRAVYVSDYSKRPDIIIDNQKVDISPFYSGNYGEGASIQIEFKNSISIIAKGSYYKYLVQTEK